MEIDFHFLKVERVRKREATWEWPAIMTELDSLYELEKEEVEGLNYIYVVLLYDWLHGVIRRASVSHLSPINIQFHVRMIYKIFPRHSGVVFTRVAPSNEIIY